jgi:hypothetical protein
MALIHPTASLIPSRNWRRMWKLALTALGEVRSDRARNPDSRSCPHPSATRIGERNEIHMGAVIGHDPQFVGFRPLDRVLHDPGQ